MAPVNRQSTASCRWKPTIRIEPRTPEVCGSKPHTSGPADFLQRSHAGCIAAPVVKKFLLRRDVYACCTADGAVLMDLTTGKYFGLDLDTAAAIAPRIEGWIERIGHIAGAEASVDENVSEDLLDSLVNGLGLLTESAKLGKSVDLPILHQTESIPFRGNILPWPRVSVHHVSAFCAAYLRALLDLKLRPLATTVRRVEARKLRRDSGPPSKMQTLELVRIFRVLRPFLFTAKDRCLFDSLALIEFLARFGAFPTWVIAVRTRPFAAHSWVVDGQLILNEVLETTEEYSPILAV
jgi:Transglutaminase-like superfamily